MAAAVAAVAPFHVPAAGSSRADLRATYVAFAGPGIQLVSEEDLANGCTRLFSTDDLAHFVDVTPHVWRLPPRYGGPCSWVAYQADFVTPDDGWVMARDGAGVTTVLAHTTDAGRTWTREPGSTTGSNGGWETIGFSSPLDGWRQQVAQGSSAPFVLQHTTDAGASWSDVHQHGGCEFDAEVFSSTTVGFATSDGTIAYRTSDGGVSWRRFTLPRPRSVAMGDTALYGQPVFAGADGAIPVTYLAPARQLVGLFVTDDGGAAWREEGVVAVRGASQLRAPTSCPGGPQATAPLVLASAGAPDAWWLLEEGAAGRSLVLTVRLHGGGLTIVGHLARGLPGTTRPLFERLFAATPTAALLEADVGASTRTWVTTDGGASWRELGTRVP